MKLFFVVVLTLFSPLVHSQECDLSLIGTVLDLHDSSPLDGATVVLAGQDIAVITDFNGNFFFKELCIGTINLQISHPECSTQVFSIELKKNTSQTFRLEHHLEELGQVLITANGYVTKSESLLENRISTNVIEQYSGGSLGDALQQVSGVSSLNTGNTIVKPIINGLHSSRITMINNGVRQQDQEWGAEHAPNIDLNTAGTITVLKGASALQYSGDAIGGVVISEPLPIPLLDSLYGKTLMSLQSNGRGGSITTSLTKSYSSGWFAKVQGTLKGYGDFEAPSYVLSNTGANEQDISINFGVNKLKYGVKAYYSFFQNKLGILRASHVGGSQDQVNAINSERPLEIEDFTYDIASPRQEVTHHLGKVFGFINLKDLGEISIQYDVQLNRRFEFDVRRVMDNTPSVDLELNSHTIMANLTSNISESVGLKTGIIGSYQNNFANPLTGVRRLIPDYDQYSWGVFGIADASLNEALTVEIGARYDYRFMDVFKFYRTSFWESRNYDVLFPDIVVEEFDNQILTNPELTFQTFSATIGSAYQINDYTIFANYALASRPPNASELFSEGLHHSASRIELGDLRFKQETAQKVTLTLQKKGERINFSVNPYANFIDDFILIEPTGIEQTIRGNFQVWEYRQTKARIIGLDTDFSMAISEDLTFNNQFSIVKGSDRTRDEALINMPPATLTNELMYQVPLGKDSFVAVKSNYVFRQNEFPDNNFEVFLPETETFENVDISTPPDAYHLLSARAGTTIKLSENNELGISLRVNNVLNTEYRDYLNRLRYYADDLGRNVVVQLKLNY